MSRQSCPRPDPGLNADLELGESDDALIEMASQKYNIVIERDDLTDLISEDCQRSLDTPLIDWAEVIPRLQNQLEEDDRKSSSDGLNLKTRINAQLMEENANECVFLEEDDLDELISESDYMTPGRLIDIEAEIRKFKEKNESDDSPEAICLESNSSGLTDADQSLEIIIDD